jgi:hypothetical protein
MQNEPNFQKSQMNVNLYNTKDYDNKHDWTLGENEPKTNPIKANTNPIQPKTNPIQTQFKPPIFQCYLKIFIIVPHNPLQKRCRTKLATSAHTNEDLITEPGRHPLP